MKNGSFLQFCLLSFGLMGCATGPTVDQCSKTAWEDMGYYDILENRNPRTYETLRANCMNVGATDPATPYNQGRDRGYSALCTSAYFTSRGKLDAERGLSKGMISETRDGCIQRGKGDFYPDYVKAFETTLPIKNAQVNDEDFAKLRAEVEKDNAKVRTDDRNQAKVKELNKRRDETHSLGKSCTKPSDCIGRLECRDAVCKMPACSGILIFDSCPENMVCRVLDKVCEYKSIQSVWGY